MKTGALVGGIVVLVLGIGYFVTANPQGSNQSITQSDTSEVASNTATNELVETNAEEAVMMDESVAADTMDTKAENMMDDAAPAVPEPVTEVAAVLPAGSYQTYSAGALAASEAETNVLFFHASWCPSCRALDGNITANQAAIPDGVAIFKADYDAETRLKADFGVVRQHSVVVLDSQGNPAGPVSHPASLDQLLSSL